MAAGYKTGGRTKGTPNIERKELFEMLAEKFPGYHPVMAMAEIANNDQQDVQLRFNASKEVAKYICPQLKSMDFNHTDMDRKIVVNVIRHTIHSKKDLER